MKRFKHIIFAIALLFLVAIIAVMAILFKQRSNVSKEKAQKKQQVDTKNEKPNQIILKGNNGLKVVYYNQKDFPWKLVPYGTSTVGESGCAPTSMAICISTLTGKTVTPAETATWAGENGYYIDNLGSSHHVIPALAKQYGVKCKGVGEKRKRIRRALKNGKLVVAIMSGGDFANTGHFIVLTDINKGWVTVADCDSMERTKQTWKLKHLIREANSGASADGPFWIISKKK